MLALSSFTLSYAPAFAAPPLSVRSPAVHMNHGMRPVYYDHDQEVRPWPASDHGQEALAALITQLTNSNPVVLPRRQGFRNRKSSYTTALDCWSSNDPRAPGQRPTFAQQPPGAPAATPPVEAPTEGTRDSSPQSSPQSSPHTSARPVYYDHDHEVRARSSMQPPRPTSRSWYSPLSLPLLAPELPRSQGVHDGLGLLVIQQRAHAWAAAILHSAAACRSACRASSRQ